jgi:hypothetical protein
MQKSGKEDFSMERSCFTEQQTKSLTDIAKYALAQTIPIAVKKNDDYVSFAIKDDETDIEIL